MKQLIIGLLSLSMAFGALATPQTMTGAKLKEMVDYSAIPADLGRHLHNLGSSKEFQSATFTYDKVSPSEINVTYKGKTTNLKVLGLRKYAINGVTISIEKSDTTSEVLKKLKAASAVSQTSWLENLFFPKAHAVYLPIVFGAWLFTMFAASGEGAKCNKDLGRKGSAHVTSADMDECRKIRKQKKANGTYNSSGYNSRFSTRNGEDR